MTIQTPASLQDFAVRRNGTYQISVTLTLNSAEESICPHCGTMTWKATGPDQSEWWTCLASPAECGLVYPRSLDAIEVLFLVLERKLFRLWQKTFGVPVWDS